MSDHLIMTEQNWKLNKKDILQVADLTEKEIALLIEDAIVMKKQTKAGIPHPHLQGKTLGMIFEKSSTRTRVSFEVGMTQLGGHALFLSSKDIQLGRGESIADTAKVLSRYVDGLMIRTFGHEIIEEFAVNSSVPIINGLTNEHHPMQVLADLMTIYEKKGKLKGLTLAYIGDGNNNMPHSLMEGAAIMGMNMHIASPKGYEPLEAVFQNVKKKGEQTGAAIQFTYDPIEAIKEADIVVTDVWTSMGMEEEATERLSVFRAYQVNANLIQYAKEDFIFLHCLPAHRGEEVTTEIIDGNHSVVYDEAENRLHAQKAVLKKLMEDK